jgi:hypothetical protein
MRQTLLACRMSEAREFGASDWRHALVAPDGNRDLLGRVTAPCLHGYDLESAWHSALKQPGRFCVISPTRLFGAFADDVDADWRDWLGERYRT